MASSHPPLLDRRRQRSALQAGGDRIARPLRVIAVAVCSAIAAGASAQDIVDNLLELSIEELSQLEVTTVSRRAESRNDAPAAVYVITSEEIERSGVRSIAEALRLAPGVEVARNGSSSWTISMRGFSSDLSNKLLVLIDGRSAYSPLYAGVFWDVQDTFLEDIDRIEVIAGPGGTLWGANAVNGVINIITRSAWDTDGGILRVGRGDELESMAGVRYAGRISDDMALRGYVKRRDFDAAHSLAGGDAGDDWHLSQAGFRLDFEAASTDSLTVQGDVYAGDERAMLRGDFTLGTLPEQYLGSIDVGGGNVLARWQRQLERGARLHVQAYYDRTERDIPGTYHEKRDTFDLDVQHDLRIYGRHDLVWGLGLRRTSDDLANTTFAMFAPAARIDRTLSLFAQDRIALAGGRVFVTLGSKFEHNDYTGFEHQPNARVSWLVTDRQTVWAALSRAVRIPARLNEDLELLAPLQLPELDFPAYVNVVGSRGFESEELLAKEVGYRIAAGSKMSFDVTLFRHEYDRLMTNEVGVATVVPGQPPYLLVPVAQGNGMRGDTYGGTLAANWQPSPGWRLEMQYSYLQFDLGSRPGSTDGNATNVAGNSPQHQAGIQSYLELPGNLGLYTSVRFVDELPNQGVPSYIAVDANLDWRPSERVTTSLTVSNLNDERHVEFGEGNAIERSAYVSVDWHF